MGRFKGNLVKLASIAGGAALLLGACGGGQATATPKPTATASPGLPSPTAAPQATATPRPAATATAQPTATATIAPAATATPRPQPTATAPQPTPTPAAAGVPSFPQARSGGTLNRRTTLPPAGFDSHVERAGDSHDLLQTVYDQLVQMNTYSQSEVIPHLAESWTSSADGLTWTFKIRRDVKFHNNTPLTAADIEHTFNRVMLKPLEKEPPSVWRDNLAQAESVTAPESYTLVIKLKGMDAAFLPGLATGRIAIYSKAMLESEGRSRMAQWPPMGTGPFMARPGGHLAGVSMEVVKNPGYYVPGRPFLNGIKYFMIPDQGTALAAFLTGQVDLLDSGVTVSMVNEAQRNLGNRLVVQKVGDTVFYSLEINAQRKPFDDIRVRQALAYAVDKQAAIGILVQGSGTIGGPIVPGTGWEIPKEELSRYAGYGTDRAANIAKAKALLAEAGYPNGFETTLLVRSRPGYTEANTLVQANLKEVGITAKQNLLDNARWLVDLSPSKPDLWELSANGWRAFGTDPNHKYRDFYLPTGARTFFGTVAGTDKMVQLYNAQNQEKDPAKRRQIVNQMERATLDLYGRHYLYYAITQYIFHSYVKNQQYHVLSTANMQYRDVWLER